MIGERIEVAHPALPAGALFMVFLALALIAAAAVLRRTQSLPGSVAMMPASIGIALLLMRFTTSFRRRDHGSGLEVREAAPLELRLWRNRGVDRSGFRAAIRQAPL